MLYGIKRQVWRTTLISWGSLAFLLGLGAARILAGMSGIVVVASMALLCLCWRRRMIVAVPVVILVGFLFGLWRGSVTANEVYRYDQLVDQKVAVSGVVVQDSTYGSKRQIDFLIGHIQVGEQKLPGQVRVTSFDPVEPKQGDVVIVTGKAKPGFGNYQLGMYYSKVRMVERGTSWITWLRHQFSAAILNVVPEPQASLGLGFLLGIKSQLPDSLNDQLKIVGLTHIVVASGYNLTILVRATRRLFARRSKFQATFAAAGLMVGFVGVTGLSPSMSRAALVTSLSLMAWYYGRAIHPVVLLLFSAAVTAAWNPLYVWGDVGWYLSFMAFAGVMLGAPLLQKRLFGDRKISQLVQIALETVCAELATLPLTLFVFGSVSVVAFLANILVTPLVPIAMLATFVAGLATILLPGIGSWLALPAHLILTYMISAVEWLASIPGAKQALSVSFAGFVVACAGLCILGIVMQRRIRYDYLSKSVVD
jgi:competence protein ComEC